MKATFNGETHKLTPLAFPKKGNPGHDGLYLVDELTEDKLECRVTGGGRWPLYTWVIAPNGKSYYFPKNVMPPTGTVVKFDEYASKPAAQAKTTSQPKPTQPVVEGVLRNVLTGIIETQQAYPEFLEKQLEAAEVDPLEAAAQWVEEQKATRAENQPTIAAYLTPEPTKPKRTRAPKSAVPK